MIMDTLEDIGYDYLKGTKWENDYKVFPDHSIYDLKRDKWVSATQGLLNFHYIYKITDGKDIYIGETGLDLELRHKLHKSEPCYCSAKKLDLTKSKIELLCICFKHEASRMEQLFIAQYPECVNDNKDRKTPAFIKGQLKRITQHEYRDGRKEELNLQVFTSRLFNK